MPLVDVIRAHEGSRISICADADCEAIALDLSCNRSKRYCSSTCANRNAVAADRARRAAGFTAP
ncbi:CGNR zinc finger domain-containing protein [Glutamicibacter protophormiae]|uniref:CGNR zinc finger domain-containing protein n=1 Tax=Glutamicibacter protophormiae TaxID=37930 RepID=UPI003A92CF03